MLHGDVEIFCENDMCFSCTDILIPSKEVPSDALDIKPNPEKARHPKKGKEMSSLEGTLSASVKYFLKLIYVLLAQIF